MNPILSIITINRNNAAGLRKTIESVVNQTFTDFEYIIIDGASTDESVNIIKEYADKIDYWVSEPDKGIYNAMNKGILKAKGEYLLFLNSGDWLYSVHTLNSIQNLLSKHEIIAGNIQKTDNSIDHSPNQLFIRNLLQKNIPHQAMFIKKSLFIEHGLYNEDFKILSDFQFNLKMALLGKTYCYLNEIISNYDTTGVSSNDDYYKIMLEEENKIIESLLSISILNDYKYLLNNKTFNHPSIHWIINHKPLFKLIKGLHLIFKNRNNDQ